MPEDTHSATSTGKSWATLVTAATIGALIAGAGIIGAIGVGILAAGDEAPIRVKNQSIDVEVLHSAKKWKQDGNKTQWKMSSGERGSDDFEVYIAPTNPSDCRNVLRHVGTTIRIKHSDGTWVQFRATAKKTKVKADKDLTLSADEKWIRYSPSTGGYIAVIRIDGNDVCTFSAKDAALAMVILDE